ncbi:MAG: 50S ribosomal protein L11 methyltransferase [Chloroflexota bacterium]
MNWLEVSLTVDGEMAEAVAEVLARFVPAGVVIESTAIAPDPGSEGYPVGPLRVCAYLPVDDQLDETRRRIEESLWYLGRIRPLPAPVFELIRGTDWTAAWKKHYRPVPIGERLIIVPAWLESPDETRIPISIDPGMAFGTGTHPTTQLCLELIETRFLRGSGFLGINIFDIGCGSGILSIAALKLAGESRDGVGTGRAFGVDTDPDAVASARENAANNGVADQTEFALGSVAEIKSGIFTVRQAPLVVANILASILIRLLDAGMADLIAPGGVLILSGILEEQVEDMLAKLDAHNLRVIDRRQIEDWVAFCVSAAYPSRSTHLSSPSG